MKANLCNLMYDPLYHCYHAIISLLSCNLPSLPLGGLDVLSLRLWEDSRQLPSSLTSTERAIGLREYVFKAIKIADFKETNSKENERFQIWWKRKLNVTFSSMIYTWFIFLSLCVIIFTVSGLLSGQTA